MSNVSRIVGKYKIERTDTKIDLPKSTENFVEIMRIDNLGNFYSMLLEFNNTKVIVKVIVDDNTIFELDLDKIKNKGSSGMKYDHFPVFVEDAKDAFKFKPSFPLLFRKNIVVVAKANSNSLSRDFVSGMIEISEE